MTHHLSHRLKRAAAVYRLFTILGPLIISLVLVFVIVSVQGVLGAQQNERCFAATGYCMSGRIYEYWEQNGGIPVFGMPITAQREEIIEGVPRQVQWFERNRLELHPTNDPPYDVLLGRISVDLLTHQGRDWRDLADDGSTMPDGGECRFFEQTGHAVCGDILALWQNNGLELDGRPGTSEEESLALFGLPLSGVITETLDDGQGHNVQWFERARIELHPANEPPYNVLLGRLGSELLADETAPVAQVPTPSATPSATPSPTLPPTATPRPSVTPTPMPEPIAFTSNRDGDMDIYLMSSDGSGLINLTNHPDDDSAPAWSPDGQRLVFVSNRDAATYDLYTMHPDGSDQARLINLPGDEFDPDWSPDGTKIAFNSSIDNISVVNADGSDPVNLTSSRGANWAPSWSPITMRLAFQSDRDGNWEIYTMNADGSGLVNLTNHTNQDSGPAWSPDGRRIAFVSNRDGNAEIYVMNLDGTGLTNLTRYSQGNDFDPAWSPDGERIAFVSDRDGNAEIYVMNLDGTGLTRLTYHTNDDVSPAWAP